MVLTLLFSFGVGEMPQVNQVVPSGSPTVPSLPKSPDRLGSISPFAPSAADLPSMPEPALTSRAQEMGENWGPERSLRNRTEGLRKDVSQTVRAARADGQGTLMSDWS